MSVKCLIWFCSGMFFGSFFFWLVLAIDRYFDGSMVSSERFKVVKGVESITVVDSQSGNTIILKDAAFSIDVGKNQIGGALKGSVLGRIYFTELLDGGGGSIKIDDNADGEWDRNK